MRINGRSGAFRPRVCVSNAAIAYTDAGKPMRVRRVKLMVAVISVPAGHHG